MVILQCGHAVREAEGGGELDLVFGLVLAVAPLALGGDELRLGQRVLARKLRDVVLDAVFVEEIARLELAVFLYPQPEGDSRVDDGLPVQHACEVLLRNVDIREHLDVRPPADERTGLFPVGRLDHKLLPLLAADLALLEVQLIFVPVAPDGHVHVFRRILSGAGSQTVEAEGIFIVAAVGVFVLAAGVQLAENQLPVIALLDRVPVHGTAAAEVLDLDGLVLIICQRYEIAVALARLVDGVGEDLKGGVLAAVYPVRAENDAGALADSVRALEGDYAFVAVLCGTFAHAF